MKPEKKWITPELIILQRGKPEEAVLQTCKMAGFGSGADANNNDCGTDFVAGICFNECQDQVAS